MKRIALMFDMGMGCPANQDSKEKSANERSEVLSTSLGIWDQAGGVDNYASNP